MHSDTVRAAFNCRKRIRPPQASPHATRQHRYHPLKKQSGMASLFMMEDLGRPMAVGEDRNVLRRSLVGAVKMLRLHRK